MESNSICNHKSEWLSDNWEAVLSMITDRIGQHKVLLPINHNCYNFWKKNTFRTNILEKMCKVKNSSSVKISHFFLIWLLLWLLWSILQLMDLAEWTYMWYDLLLQLSDCRCLITVNGLSTEWLVKNKSANAPITFEEIVIVMINSVFAFLEAP